MNLFKSTALAVAAVFGLGVSAGYAQVAPTFSKSVSPNTVGNSGNTTITYTIGNSDPSAMEGLAFSETLPGGLVVSLPNGASTTCAGGVVTAAPITQLISFSGGNLPAGQSCQVTVDIREINNPTYGAPAAPVSTLLSSVITTTTDHLTGPTSTADLNVSTDVVEFFKNTSPATVELDGTSRLTYTLLNHDLTFVGGTFSETFPPGVSIAPISNLTHDCGGIVSAPANGNSVSVHSISMANGAVCTIEMDIVVSTVGQHLLKSSPFSYSTGIFKTIGFSSDFVAVDPIDPSVPRLSKSFIDDPVAPGGVAQLRYTIVNSDAVEGVTDMSFTDDFGTLIPGATVSLGSASDVCGTGSAITLSAGDSFLTFSGGNLGARDRCDFIVDINVPPAPGSFAFVSNTSSFSGTKPSGAFNIGGSGATLQIASFLPLEVTKAYSAASVASPGSVDVTYTLTNPQSAGTLPVFDNVSFTDNFGGPIGGVSITPHVSSCGTVSLAELGGHLHLVGTITTLFPADPCVLSATLSIPTGQSAGTVTTDMSDVLYQVSGGAVSAPGVAEPLDVLAPPELSLVKSFSVANTTPNSAIEMTLTVRHDGDAGSVSGVTFTDDLDGWITGTTFDSLVSATCDVVVGGTGVLTVSDMALSPGQSCSLVVALDLGTEPAGTYTNTAGPVTASVNGAPAEVFAAAVGSADLTLNDYLPIEVEHTVTPATVFPGDDVVFSYQFTNPNDIGATNVFFEHYLLDIMPGLVRDVTAVTNTCDALDTGSNTLLTLSSFPMDANEICTVAYTVTIPASASSGDYGSTTRTINASLGGALVRGTPSLAQLSVDADVLSVAKSFDAASIVAGNPTTVTFDLVNTHPTEDATSVAFTDDLNAFVPGATFASLAPSSCAVLASGTGSSNFSATNVTVPAASSCQILVVVNVPVGTATGTYTNTTSSFSGTVNAVPVSAPAASADLLVLSATAPSLVKSYIGSMVLGGNIVARYVISSPSGGNDFGFSDDLDAVMPGFAATSLPSNPCGAGSSITGTGNLVVSGANLVPGGVCTIDVNLQIPVLGTSGIHSGTTSDLTSNGLVVASGATASLTVEPKPVFRASFAPASVELGLPTTLTFTIDNTTPIAGAFGVSFGETLTDDLLLATPVNAVSSCGGTLTAAAGSADISFAVNEVAAGTQCTVSVDVVSSSTGSKSAIPTNLTYNGGVPVDAPTALLTVTPPTPPTFTSAFAPNVIAQGEVSRLTYTITNVSPALPATGMVFATNLPTGVTMTTPANETNTCGGTLIAIAGGGAIGLSGGTLAASGSCTVSVDVTSALIDTYTDTTGNLNSSLGSTPGASANLVVGAAPTPSVTATFVPDSIQQGDTSVLQIAVLSNANLSADALGFSVDLPPGMTMTGGGASLSGDCTGTVTATPGSAAGSVSAASVDPLGSCTFSFPVTSILVGDAVFTSGSVTSSLGNSGTATDTLSVAVQPNAMVTFVHNSDTDGTYSHSATEAVLNFDVTVSGGTGSSGALSVPAGVHLVSHTAPTGVGISDVSCSDANSIYDAGTGVLSLDVEALETVTCTYTSLLSSEKTVETINNFLSKRTNLILANQPSMGRRLDRLRRGESVERMTYTAGDLTGLKPFTFDVMSIGSGNYNFSTSLDQVTRAAEKMRLVTGAAGFEETYHTNSKFDVWFEATYSKFNGTGDSGGNFAMAYLGADYLVNPDLLVGALVQFDQLKDSSTVDDYTIEGTGWMVGPYVTARLSDRMYLDARVAWGKSSNDISPFNTYTDSFDTTRWLANATLSGDFDAGQWKVRPNVSLSYMSENAETYVDGLGATVPSQTLARGMLRMGPNFSTRIQGDHGVFYEPFFTFDAIYSYDETTGVTLTDPSSPDDGWRARVEGGMTVFFADGGKLSFTGNYDGIGQSGFNAWGVGLGYALDF